MEPERTRRRFEVGMIGRRFVLMLLLCGLAPQAALANRVAVVRDRTYTRSTWCENLIHSLTQELARHGMTVMPRDEAKYLYEEVHLQDGLSEDPSPRDVTPADIIIRVRARRTINGKYPSDWRAEVRTGRSAEYRVQVIWQYADEERQHLLWDGKDGDRSPVVLASTIGMQFASQIATSGAVRAQVSEDRILLAVIPPSFHSDSDAVKRVAEKIPPLLESALDHAGLLLVEREKIDDVLKEHIVRSMNDDEIFRAGRLIGAQVLLTSALVDLGDEMGLYVYVMDVRTGAPRAMVSRRFRQNQSSAAVASIVRDILPKIRSRTLPEDGISKEEVERRRKIEAQTLYRQNTENSMKAALYIDPSLSDTRTPNEHDEIKRRIESEAKLHPALEEQSRRHIWAERWEERIQQVLSATPDLLQQHLARRLAEKMTGSLTDGKTGHVLRYLKNLMAGYRKESRQFPPASLPFLAVHIEACVLNDPHSAAETYRLQFRREASPASRRVDGFSSTHAWEHETARVASYWKILQAYYLKRDVVALAEFITSRLAEIGAGDVEIENFEAPIKRAFFYLYDLGRSNMLVGILDAGRRALEYQDAVVDRIDRRGPARRELTYWMAELEEINGNVDYAMKIVEGLSIQKRWLDTFEIRKRLQPDARDIYRREYYAWRAGEKDKAREYLEQLVEMDGVPSDLKGEFRGYLKAYE